VDTLKKKTQTTTHLHGAVHFIHEFITTFNNDIKLLKKYSINKDIHPFWHCQQQEQYNLWTITQIISFEKKYENLIRFFIGTSGV
jgi:hypothetical protein